MGNHIQILKKEMVQRGIIGLTSFLLIKECINILNEFYSLENTKPSVKELNQLYNECRKYKIEKSSKRVINFEEDLQGVTVH